MPARALIAACIVALLAGIGGAAWRDAVMRRQIRDAEATLAARRAELRPMAAIAAEVARWQRNRDRLRQQIDVINKFMQTRTSSSVPFAVLQRVAPLPERVVCDDAFDMTFASPRDAALAAASLTDLRAVPHGRATFRITPAVVDGAHVRLHWTLEAPGDV